MSSASSATSPSERAPSWRWRKCGAGCPALPRPRGPRPPAHFPVNKMVPPTPGTVPLSIPATFLHDVGEQLAQTSNTGVKVRQYSDYPFPWRTDGGPRDEFERAALLRLRASKGQETVHEFTEIGGQRHVLVA